MRGGGWCIHGREMARAEYDIPAADGQVRIAPPAEELPELARANAALRASYEFRIGDVPAATLARQIRADCIRLAGDYTRSLGAETPSRPFDLVIATGHQPVLPHPGIWLKNHLAWRVAQAAGGMGLNFVVDNDTVDLRAIRVPVETGAGPEVRAVPFIDCPSGVTAEEMPARARDTAPAAALAEVARLAGSALDHTLADEFAAAAEPSNSLVDLITRPRRRIEGRFGVHNLELPVGRLAETDGFRAFFAHIVDNAERFVEVYNAALDRHRAEHGITNPVDPVPNLRRHGRGLEVPFWAWRAGEPRGPILVEPGGGAGRLHEEGLKIRPRALAMTMFFRLLCCDLFIHGMGGARYEPVNDAIIREFFGVEPPAYGTASATLRVRPRTAPPRAGDVAELRQRLRRMRATPERFVDELLPDDPEARELAGRRTALRQPAGATKRERRAAFREAKSAASQLQERLAPHILAVEKELARAERLGAVWTALADRTFPFFLHSRAALDRLYALPALRQARDETAQDPRP